MHAFCTHSDSCAAMLVVVCTYSSTRRCVSVYMRVLGCKTSSAAAHERNIYERESLLLLFSVCVCVFGSDEAGKYWVECCTQTQLDLMGKDKEKIEFLARRVTVVRAGQKLWDKRRTRSPENSHICGNDFSVKFLGEELFGRRWM